MALVLPWALVALLAVTSLWLGRRGRAELATPGTVRFVADLDQAQSLSGTMPVLLTPDGRTLVATVVSGRRTVLLARRLDSLGTRIIPGSEGATRPFLSADGRWVGFSANGKLLKLPIEGGTPITLAESRWGGGTWGPDGTIIYPQSYQAGLWRVSASGGEARRLTEPDSAADELAHWWPQLLPGGRHVLFTAFRAPVSRATVEVLDLESGTRKVLVTGGVMARYTPSGHLLFARDESILAVPFDLERLEVTGAPVVVVDDVAMNLSDGFAAYDVSPSGTLAVIPASVAGGKLRPRRGGPERRRARCCWTSPIGTPSDLLARPAPDLGGHHSGARRVGRVGRGPGAWRPDPHHRRAGVGLQRALDPGRPRPGLHERAAVVRAVPARRRRQPSARAADRRRARSGPRLHLR